RERVAPERERLPLAHAVGEHARRELHEDRDALGDALDEADLARAEAEDVLHEEGDRADGHLARHVREERGEAEREDVPRESHPVMRPETKSPRRTPPPWRRCDFEDPNPRGSRSSRSGGGASWAC